MFIQEFAEIYHPRHVVYVFHSPCHMKKFVDLYGPWDNFSSEVKLIGRPFKYYSSVNDEVDTRRFNIFKSPQILGEIVTFNIEDIDGKCWELNIYNSSSKAYYPIYVEDGKTFRRN